MDNHGQTCLHHLLLNNQKCDDIDSLTSVALYFLQWGIRATESLDEHKLSPVILAVRERYSLQLIRQLLNHVPLLHTLLWKDAEGKSPLDWARHWQKLSEYRFANSLPHHG